MTRSVQTLRLSGLDACEAVRAAADLLADRSVADLSSLLVLDDTATLLAHAAAFEDLLTSGRLNYLLCVAIGPPADGRWPIALPGGISSGQGSAVLWVSDPLGVDWPLSASAVALIRPAGPRSGLYHLIEVLSAAEVFDRVRELVLRLPGGVASPALRLAGESEETASFAVALAGAIRRLTRSSESAETSRAGPLISAQDARLGSVRLAERGKLASTAERCVAAAEDAAGAVEQLAGVGGLLGSGQLTAARRQVIAAGEVLQSLRNQVREVFEQAHAPRGLTERQRQRLQEAGLQLTGPQLGGPLAGAPLAGPRLGGPLLGGPLAGAPLAGAPLAGAPLAGAPLAGAPLAGAPLAGPLAGAQLGGPQLAGRASAGSHDGGPASSGAGLGPEPAAVHNAVAERIRAGDPLPHVVDRLALAERQLSPQGSQAYLPEVDQRCPESLVRRLTEPPPLPRLQWWLPVTGAVAAALGSIAGLTGIITGLAITLAWTWLIVRAIGGLAGVLPASRRELGANVAGALAGMAVGVLIGLSLKPSAPVAGAALAAGVVIAFVAVAQSWRSRVTGWQHLLSPGQAASAADALTELVARVATAEWSADPAMLDAIVRARIIVQGVCDQLREYADGIDTGDGSEPPASRVSAGLSRLTGGLSPILRQLVLTVLAAQPAAGRSDGQAAYRQAQAKTGELIATWVTIARERGPHAWPPFAESGDDPTAYVGDEELAAITSVAAYDPYGVMWQLCAPGDLTMLDAGGRPGLVAFAPLITRQQLIRELPADTAWTPPGQRAGLLRLVPLRAGSVELIWSTDARAEPQE